MAIETSPSSTSVLVTGGSGFIGSYVILDLLHAGYIVHTTVRSLSKEATVRSSLASAGASDEELQRLTFFAANLEKDEGWTEATAGCTYVQHVASPFPLELPKHEDELIIPARDGTLRILRAAKAAGVKRVVMTSSLAAIGYGHPPQKEPYTEKTWSNLDGKIPVPPYPKSKTIAEKAAWDFIEKDGEGMELATVNPVGVFGPILGTDISSSIQIVKKLIDGSVPGCPQMYFAGVDVRDVASLHILAMTRPEAKGERFLAVSSDKALSMFQIAQIIKKNRPDNAKKVPTIQIPNFVVKLLSYFDPPIKQILPELGQVNTKESSNEKAKTTLGWAPISYEASILDTVDSLVKHKLV